MPGARLFLLRHAIAEPRDPQRWPDDAARPLTEEGAARMAEAARGMLALGLRFDLILTSPYARAARTAAIVAHELRPSLDPAATPALAPGGTVEEVLAAIPPLKPERGSVLLVGHEPDLTRLASGLLLPEGSALPLELRKGGLLRIDLTGATRPGRGRLVYHLKPKILRMLADAATARN